MPTRIGYLICHMFSIQVYIVQELMKNIHGFSWIHTVHIWNLIVISMVNFKENSFQIKMQSDPFTSIIIFNAEKFLIWREWSGKFNNNSYVSVRFPQAFHLSCWCDREQCTRLFSTIRRYYVFFCGFMTSICLKKFWSFN